MPKMTGARYFAQFMHSHGVTGIFFVPAIVLKPLTELEDMSICRSGQCERTLNDAE